jgi:hypothetical protein
LRFVISSPVMIFMKLRTYIILVALLLLSTLLLPVALVSLDLISWDQCHRLSGLCGKAFVVVACCAFALGHVLKGKNFFQ